MDRLADEARSCGQRSIWSLPDWLELRTLLSPVTTSDFGTTQFSKHVAGVPLDQLLEYGRGLLEEAPRTRAELHPLLAQRWPVSEAPALAQAVTYLLPVIQVPPRGLWGKKGPARWTTTESWLGTSPHQRGSVERSWFFATWEPLALRQSRTSNVVGPGGPSRIVEKCSAPPGVPDEGGIELFDVPEGPDSRPTCRRRPVSCPSMTTFCSVTPTGHASFMVT